MKKTLKITTTALASSLMLTSCFSTNPTFKSTSAENVDHVPLKISDLTEIELKNWNQKDLLLDTIPGMSVDRAYNELLRHKKNKTVIVAVIDSGIDINHPDLKGKIWTNEKERPNNGRDDDNNGYVDDVNGWNFLGNVVDENLEFTRIIRDYQEQFEGKTAQNIPAKDQELFKLYKEAKVEYAAKVAKANQVVEQYSPLYQKLNDAHKYASAHFKKENYTQKEVYELKPKKEAEQAHKQIIIRMYPNVEKGEYFGDFVKGLEGYINQYKEKKETHFNLSLNARKKLNDNENDFTTKFYGNNKVGGPDSKLEDAKHGTHVAGIIAANRNNGIGAKGIAENVKIMPIRAVPNGDEYDKDIALAIRYAVNNGATVINTSFGKYFSTHSDWVRDAIKYAGSKDVLIVNAAGNESKDLDKIDVYPNDQTQTIPEISNNFITIGALNYEYGTKLIASFSNYGKSNVDIFAPGVKIYSTTPLNTYEYLQGTSMAAPSVAGVAAVLRSYFPDLSAKQIKNIIMESGNSSKTNVTLGKSGGRFSDASKSGKMVNLYNAILLANKL